MAPSPWPVTCAAALVLAFAAPALAAPMPAEPAPLPAAEAPAPDEEAPAFDAGAMALRHGQLTIHQGFGLATLGAMATTGALGFWSATLNGPGELRDIHLVAAGLTTGLYLTTATLALSAPPNPLAIGRTPAPWDTVEIHRRIAWLHAAGMIATLGLGTATLFGADQVVTHGVLAATTFGLTALSAGVVAFGE